MKKFKTILAFIMLASTLVSLLALASCGLFESKVEKTIDKILISDSFTCILEEKDNDCKSTLKIDSKKKKLYICVEEKGDVEEYYLWYDKKDDKYYEATVEETEIQKKQVSRERFIDRFSSYFIKATERNVDLPGYRATIKIWEESDGKYYYSNDLEGKNQISIWVDGSDLYISKLYGDSDSNNYTFTDINKTKFEIPDNILDTKAESLK